MKVTSFIHFGTPRAEQIHFLAYFPPERAPRWLARQEPARRARRGGEPAMARAVPRLADGFCPRSNATSSIPIGRSRGKRGTEFRQLQGFLSLIYERKRVVYPDSSATAWGSGRGGDELFGWSPEDAIECSRADGGSTSSRIRYASATRRGWSE